MTRRAAWAMDSDPIEAFWRGYLDTPLSDSPTRYEQDVAERFGDSPQPADQPGALVVSGTKTATCSAFWEWEAGGSSLPEISKKSLVLDGHGDPLCIIGTTEVKVRPYNEVDALFAYEEGEGDRSLEHWREAHRRFFSRTLLNIGKKPTPDMPLVCERFRVIYD
jgi:uncharacterized protein YhfF